MRNQLAIEGGKPVRKNLLTFGKPLSGGLDIEEVGERESYGLSVGQGE